MLASIKNIHFIGIGGIGMSGIAEFLHFQGFQISGSDLIKSDRTDYLSNLGIKIHIGHSVKNINNPDVVVYSSAVKIDNIEILESKNKNIPVIKRAEMLAELLKLKEISVAISGTHGKTTSCSMLSSILVEAELKPTVIIGGIVNNFGSNTLSGAGDIIFLNASNLTEAIDITRLRGFSLQDQNFDDSYYDHMMDEINSNENTNIDEMLNKIPRNQRSKGYEQHYGRTIDLGFRFSF